MRPAERQRAPTKKKLLLEMAKPMDEMFFISFDVLHLPCNLCFGCEMHQEISPLLSLHGECNGALNVWNEMENRYIFHLLQSGFALENSFLTCRRRNFWSTFNLICLSVMKDLCNVLKAF